MVRLKTRWFSCRIQYQSNLFRRHKQEWYQRKLEVLRDAEYIESEVRERYQAVTDTRNSEGWEKSRRSC